MLVARMDPIDIARIAFHGAGNPFWEADDIFPTQEEKGTRKRRGPVQELERIDERGPHHGKDGHEATAERERATCRTTMQLADRWRIAPGHVRKLPLSDSRFGDAAAKKHCSYERDRDATGLFEHRPAKLANDDEAVTKLMREDSIWRLPVHARYDVVDRCP